MTNFSAARKDIPPFLSFQHALQEGQRAILSLNNSPEYFDASAYHSVLEGLALCISVLMKEQGRIDSHKARFEEVKLAIGNSPESTDLPSLRDQLRRIDYDPLRYMAEQRALRDALGAIKPVHDRLQIMIDEKKPPATLRNYKMPDSPSSVTSDADYDLSRGD